MSETCSEGGQDIGTIQNGAYVVYNNMDFGVGAVAFNARVASAASGGNIELHLDSTNGTLVGTCAVPGTGGWQTWVTTNCQVSGVSGIHNLYLKFTGGSGYLFNVEWWDFNCTNLPAPPPAPAGLMATAGVERAALRWMAASNATAYSVKRAVTNGGPYTTVANVAGTNYNDFAAMAGTNDTPNGVIAGTNYYYVVSAQNVGGESANSGQASAIPTDLVPAPWMTRDIGAVGLAGWASFTNGEFTVTGSGADIGRSSDAFRFVQLTATGNYTIVALVNSASEQAIDPGSKAGVMIRDSLDNPGAANAFIAVTPSDGVIWQCRSSDGGVTSTNYTTGLSAPCWVKLVRIGNTFTGYSSPDGVTWTQRGSATFTMSSTAYAGLAVTAHEGWTQSTATFDHVTGPGWNPPLATVPAGLVATGGVERVALRWTAASNATSYNVKRATTSGGPYTTIANVTTTNYTDTVIGRTTYYYVVSAENSLAGESGNSAQASAYASVNVPLPWMTQDIGAVGVPGGAGLTNGVFSVSGSGADIWNSADAFRFVYVMTNGGNYNIIARVRSVQNIDGWSKAGVMIRDSLDPGAANVFIAVTPGNGVSFQYRSSDGGGCNNNTTGGSAPYWVKLAVSSGTNFTGYCSSNGTNWTLVGSTSWQPISPPRMSVWRSPRTTTHPCAWPRLTT